jgi:very-short-patch-repair endonuclease
MRFTFCPFVTHIVIRVSLIGVMRQVVTSRRIDGAVARIAAKQHGVFTLQQVEQAGGDSWTVYRRITSGVWLRLGRRVYGLAGTPISFPARVTAACLSAGEWSFASHRTAAELWLPTGTSPAIHLWSPTRIRAAGFIAHVGRLDKADVTRFGVIPITRPERTVIDLASMLTPEQLEGTLDEFLRRELVRLQRLEDRLHAAGNRPGVRTLRRLAAERRGSRISESELETRLLRALREEGLPLPMRQYEIRDGERLVGRADFAYPRVNLAIEAYGRENHSTWTDLEHDLARQNEITVLGWRVLVVTWSRLHTQRAALMRTIAKALAS